MDRNFNINEKVISVKHRDEQNYQIKCENYTYDLLISNDSYSESWFEMNFTDDELIGKHISNIRYSNQIKLPYSGRRKQDVSDEYHINVVDSKPLIFYLRKSLNSSYYSGWIQITRTDNKLNKQEKVIINSLN